MKVLVTGGSGFIGSNLVQYFLKNKPDWEIVNVDALTYAADKQFKPAEVERVKLDITDTRKVKELFRSVRPDTVFHLAAESHVDRSIAGPSVFVKTNVVGTHNLLEAAQFYGVDRFIHVSTDEVYGSLPIVPDWADPRDVATRFTELSPICPSSPYSASKAASDFLALSYFTTYKLPVIVTRCSNNYGPRQHPEKFIPRMILKAIKGEKLPVYGNGLNVRDWIHVKDHCRGILAAWARCSPGEIYNFGGNSERSNIDVAKLILKHCMKSYDLIEYVQDRPGHDLRYAIDPTKAKDQLKWVPEFTFDEGLHETVLWYLTHQEWCERMAA